MSAKNEFMEAHEIDYHRANYRGRRDRDEVIAEALANANAFVDEHARDFLPSIQTGIYRTMFLHTLEPDTGEKRLLLGTVACLRELGEQCRENSVKD